MNMEVCVDIRLQVMNGNYLTKKANDLEKVQILDTTVHMQPYHFFMILHLLKITNVCSYNDILQALLRGMNVQVILVRKEGIKVY